MVEVNLPDGGELRFRRTARIRDAKFIGNINEDMRVEGRISSHPDFLDGQIGSDTVQRFYEAGAYHPDFPVVITPSTIFVVEG